MLGGNLEGHQAKGSNTEHSGLFLGQKKQRALGTLKGTQGAHLDFSKPSGGNDYTEFQA